MVVLTSPTDAIIAFGNTAVVGLGGDSAVASTPVPARAHYFLAPEGRYTANVRSSGHPARDVVIDVPAHVVAGVMVRLDDAAAAPLQMAVSAGADRSVALNQNVDLDGHVETGGADTPFAISWSVDKGPRHRHLRRPQRAPHGHLLREARRLPAAPHRRHRRPGAEQPRDPLRGAVRRHHYYVDGTGPTPMRAPPGGAAGDPDGAGELVRAGDIVRIRDGIYYQYNDMNGSLGLPATPSPPTPPRTDPSSSKAEPGEHAVFDGTNSPNATHRRRRPRFPPHAPPYSTSRYATTSSATSSSATAQWRDLDRGSDGTEAAATTPSSTSNSTPTTATASPRAASTTSPKEPRRIHRRHNNASTRNGGNSADGIKCPNDQQDRPLRPALQNSDDGVDFYGSDRHDHRTLQRLAQRLLLPRRRQRPLQHPRPKRSTLLQRQRLEYGRNVLPNTNNSPPSTSPGPTNARPHLQLRRRHEIFNRDLLRQRTRRLRSTLLTQHHPSQQPQPRTPTSSPPKAGSAPTAPCPTPNQQLGPQHQQS